MPSSYIRGRGGERAGAGAGSLDQGFPGPSWLVLP